VLALLSSVELVSCGMTTEARTAMITTTINTSTKVNPLCRRNHEKLG
jgi:hypothetical protein